MDALKKWHSESGFWNLMRLLNSESRRTKLRKDIVVTNGRNLKNYFVFFFPKNIFGPNYSCNITLKWSTRESDQRWTKLSRAILTNVYSVYRVWSMPLPRKSSRKVSVLNVFFVYYVVVNESIPMGNAMHRISYILKIDITLTQEVISWYHYPGMDLWI